METKMLLKDELLWSRIQSFSIDASNVDFPFSKKLAREENWTEIFTKKAIEEYKKFVYLCCVLPNGASPSDIVDKVWHKHLIYTQNYWEEFCPDILQQKLHHHPSTGGSYEKTKHKNWFEDTLKNYTEIFQQDPPEEIWKTSKNKINKNWIEKLRFLLILIIPLILISCSDSTMGTFATLFFTALSIGIFLLIRFITSMSNDPSRKNDKNDDGSGFGSSCTGSSSCSGGSSCGSGCGGGCGGCGS